MQVQVQVMRLAAWAVQAGNVTPRRGGRQCVGAKTAVLGDATVGILRGRGGRRRFMKGRQR